MFPFQKDEIEEENMENEASKAIREFMKIKLDNKVDSDIIFDEFSELFSYDYVLRSDASAKVTLKKEGNFPKWFRFGSLYSVLFGTTPFKTKSKHIL